MAVKDISDVQVCLAAEFAAYLKDEAPFGCLDVPCAAEVLMEITGQCYKVCVQAIERTSKRGYVDNWIREYIATLTTMGYELLAGQRVRIPYIIHTVNGVDRIVLCDYEGETKCQ